MRRTKPTLRCDERNVAPELAGQPGGGYHGHPNPLPFSAHSVPGKSCAPPPSIKISFPQLRPAHPYEPRTTIRDRSDLRSKTNPRTTIDGCQGALEASLATCTRAGRVCNCGPGGLLRLSQSRPNRPSVRVGRPIETLVRKTSRVDHAVARRRRVKHARHGTYCQIYLSSSTLLFLTEARPSSQMFPMTKHHLPFASLIPTILIPLDAMWPDAPQSPTSW